MSGFFRFLLLSILFYLVFKAIRKISILGKSRGHNSQDRDASKEVKNASFNSEDVTDATFKDIK